MNIDYEAKAAKAVVCFANNQGITWEQFERFMGLHIRPDHEGTLEWKGYVQKRNHIRQSLNGAAMELGKGKAFQIRVTGKDDKGERLAEEELQFLSGTALFENWSKQLSTRMVNAPKNFVSVMQEMSAKFSLPPKTRNKAINYATVGNMLAGVTKKMIEDVLDDPEMSLPDYSRDELLRLTMTTANTVLHDDDAA